MSEKQRILVIEDDANIAKYIVTCLEMGGYDSFICNDGDKAIPLIEAGDYDLVLLDVMLPGTDGFSIMESVSSLELPVIFLTAMQDVADKVRGLKLGAEDYIVKPFEALELLARIEVALRRYHKQDARLVYRDIVIDTEKHTVTLSYEPVMLTPKEFDVLVYFVSNQDIVISRERLLSSVWGYAFEGESRTIDTHVQQVRKKMGLQGSLITVPKYGYKLVGSETL
ncbi:response regulator transcription factor [Christensenellaceae bacterium OttesenSCG-928-K19]|nr:response regulator transcription factor [Christensenellaceae bacterium OttesenSCG-928-K19]